MRDKNTRMQLGDMTAFINSSLNPRGANDKNGERMANYIFTRAHDTEAQTIIQRIIRDRINPNLFGYNFTRDEIKKAFEIYNEDIDKAHKTYASYNLPSVYALMLTNKDSVTRVYYGDLYREDGHYMLKRRLTLMPLTPSCVLVSSMQLVVKTWKLRKSEMTDS